MVELVEVVEGRSTIEKGLPVIDCDNVKPDVPALKVFYHDKQGKAQWQKVKMATSLFQTGEQKNEAYATLVSVSEQLETLGMRAYNASPINYLLSHKWLIPDEWKGLNVFFPKTIFESGGQQCVYGLCYPGYWRAISIPVSARFSGFSKIISAVSSSVNKALNTF